ncbi:hypothetical protein LEMLEM_LOCUS23376, partial [Lemmus lemmus]
EQGEEDVSGQPSSYTASLGERSNKERYTETEKDKSPEAKGSQHELGRVFEDNHLPRGRADGWSTLLWKKISGKSGYKQRRWPGHLPLALQSDAVLTLAVSPKRKLGAGKLKSGAPELRIPVKVTQHQGLPK